MESDFTNQKVLIAGLGLIGGSFAKALHAHGYNEIYAFDRDEQTLANAKRDGIIREGYTSLSGDLPTFALVLCCLSPMHVAELYEDAAPYMSENSVFAEVGGIKTVMIRELNIKMQPKHQLLSLHPMAGSEKAGYAHANKDMFAKSVLIMIPTSKTGRAALGWAKVFELTMGFKCTLQLSADEHDHIIAHVSHIPHVAALAIKAMYPGSGDKRFAGGSYAAVTRVADINATLWAGLMTDNKGSLLECIDELKKQLDVLEKAIEAGDAPALQVLLEKISKG